MAAIIVNAAKMKHYNKPLLNCITAKLRINPPVALQQEQTKDLVFSYAVSRVDLPRSLLNIIDRQVRSDRTYTPRQLAFIIWSLGFYGNQFKDSLTVMALLLHRADVKRNIHTGDIVRIVSGLGKAGVMDQVAMQWLLSADLGKAVGSLQAKVMLEGLVSMREQVGEKERKALEGIAQPFMTKLIAAMKGGKITTRHTDATNLVSIITSLAALRTSASSPAPLISHAYTLLHHLTPLEVATVLSSCATLRYTPPRLYTDAFESTLLPHLSDPAIRQLYDRSKLHPSQDAVATMIGLVPP
eukprot:TRINITY_DN16208_c0_g1_i1.p1 TRINITY_DN16208_c0_g1~~TRINITY_DN16208_c0_g1_i1.p1  ORF type:complete len:338 (+),score=79.69 TRINITY_DN16208_c0_g1_i1:118-1014(+)